MIPSWVEREEIGARLGITRCPPCLRLCPYCPRLVAIRPDLAWKPPVENGDSHNPSLVRKAINVSKAIVEHVEAGLPETSRGTVDQRWAICRSCEKFDSDRVSCCVCGCYLNIKINWAEQKCPIGKW